MATVFFSKRTHSYLRRARCRGLTLLELMITVAIAAILLTAVGPNIQSILISNQITSSLNNTSSIIRFARNTAINEQTDVIICPSTDLISCVNNWDQPKIVFVDANNNQQIDGNERLLTATERLSDTLRISGINGILRFTDDGSTPAAQTIVFCHDNREARFARAIIITQFGRVTISQDSNNDGIAEDDNGNALMCA